MRKTKKKKVESIRDCEHAQARVSESAEKKGKRGITGEKWYVNNNRYQEWEEGGN